MDDGSSISNPDYLITSNVNGVDVQQQVQVEGQDSWDVQIQYNPFRILLKSNGQILVVVNNEDTLFFESGTEAVQQSISMGYFVNAVNMFGLPERAAEFKLNFTDTQGPYRLWTQDAFDHPWGSLWPLYSSIPYLVGHAASQTAAVAWLNSAETFVDLF